MKRAITFLFLVTLLSLTSYAARSHREVININKGWSFSYGWQFSHRSELGELVNIPHTWNLDALSGIANYYRGLGNYLRELDIKASWRSGKKVYLRFEGVSQSAEVYVNGRRVGAHQGGYTAFGFDITPYLNFDGVNTLWVRVNNAQNLDLMPLSGNFNIYGGIYRNVELIVTPAVHISHTQYATSGVRVTQKLVSNQKAVVDVVAEIEGMSSSVVNVQFKLKDSAGNSIDSLQRNVKIGISGRVNANWALTIHNPKLWHGTIDPHRYRIEVVTESSSGGRGVAIASRDSVCQYFGLRNIEVSAQNEFLLNGKKYPIRGVTKFQDYALLGSAIYPEEDIRDMELIAEMGVNALRLVHYPHSEHFIELCDKVGIIVWSEIPFIGPGEYRNTGFNNSTLFRDNGILQLQEMLAQQYNNPSVVFIGLFNEIAQRGDDPLQYIRQLNMVAKDESGGRLTVAASNQNGEINFVTDLIGFNQYLGWKEGMPNDIDRWAQSVRGEWPRLKVALSEYGAGASIYQHEIPATRPVVDSYWHPEEWQTAFHEEYLRTISKGYFWGTFASSMFDWGAAHLRLGNRPGISDMGLVTFDRASKKDAFYLYKANWNSDESFVHITSKRYVDRAGLSQDIKVISPSDSVTLVVNGKEVATLGNSGVGTFTFTGCKMERGENTIKALSLDGSQDSIMIRIVE